MDNSKVYVSGYVSYQDKKHYCGYSVVVLVNQSTCTESYNPDSTHMSKMIRAHIGEDAYNVEFNNQHEATYREVMAAKEGFITLIE